MTWSTYSLTIPLDPNTNVATFRLAPGCNKYELFCQEAGISIFEEEDVDDSGNILHADHHTDAGPGCS